MRNNNFSIIDKLGYDINGSTDLSSALEAANLNWTAKESPVCYKLDDGSEMTDPYHRALYRSTDGEYLGIVGKKYQVVQNDEAFAMTEALLGEMQYVKGGQFGSQTSVTMRAPDTTIEGDVIKNYITIRNSFDGSSKVQFAWIPVRQVCENGLCVSVPELKRVFELPHTGNVNEKYQKLLIENAICDGTEAVKKYAASLLKIRCGQFELTKILDKFFPINGILEEDKIVSTKIHNKNLLKRQEIAIAMGQDDLANFSGTAYQIFQAFCDFETHSTGVVSSNPRIAAHQQFLRAFTGFSITASVMKYLTELAK